MLAAEREEAARDYIKGSSGNAVPARDAPLGPINRRL
jgi:hypothetical protein